MKSLLCSILFIAYFTANAEAAPFVEPLHTGEQVLSALYRQEKIEPSQVKVIIFRFDHIKGIWHIELAPAKEACIDCYPSYYFENKEKLILQKVPHG